MYDILELSKKLLPELKEIARELKITKAESLKKQDLIYRILDQQAIEATEKTEVIIPEQKEKQPEDQITRDESESERRRGKRPRTFKPVVKQSIESVMSVSPDDLSRPDTRPSERTEYRKSDRAGQKPDLFKDAEPVQGERKAPKWRQDQHTEGRGTRKVRFDKPDEEIPKKTG